MAIGNRKYRARPDSAAEVRWTAQSAHDLEATAAIAFQSDLSYRDGVEDLKLEVPVTEEVEVDAKTLAAIDRGTADADAGRVVSLEEARKLVPQWISKFESQKPR
jgi:predicted transcriptional regulator